MTKINIADFMSEIVENKDNVNNYVPPMNVFRISQIPYCSRGIYYSKVRPDDAKPFTFKQKGRFLLGNLVHGYLEKKFKGVAVSTEKTVKHKFKDILLKGHIDIELPDKVLDVKTVNEKSFIYRLMDEKPSYHHYIQANTYAMINGSKLVSILYVSIVDFSFIERVLDVTPEIFEKICEKAQMIYECIQNEKPPEPDWVETWECSYCNFTEICDAKNGK